MPGSIANAAPATVLPWSLCRSFGHSREYLIDANQYRNGESQRGLLVATSRKSWTTMRRLTPTILKSFRNFYKARRGPEEPFYFYDPWDTSPKFAYDSTGIETVGRYTVRFTSPWEQSVELGRANIPINIVELA